MSELTHVYLAPGLPDISMFNFMLINMAAQPLSKQK